LTGAPPNTSQAIVNLLIFIDVMYITFIWSDYLFQCALQLLFLE
jgi:hypothetical protein